MLYLDYCATSPPLDEVLETMTDVTRLYYGNPSSIHKFGVQAERLVNKARDVIASALSCRPTEIVFTSGGTEGNNLAVKGAAQRYRDRGRHIIVSAIEHASVYESAKQLESIGFDISYVKADATGAVSVDDVAALLRDDTILVSLMHVNNETGRIQPVREIGELLKQRPKTLFHVDAVQAFGRLDTNPAVLGADLVTGSAHKLRGPKGAGFLYVRDGVELSPLLVGGGQERGRRSGTENVPAIVGMAKAVRLAADHRGRNVKGLYRLRSRLISGLRALPGVVVTGSEYESDMAPQLVHFCVPGYRSEVIVHALEQRGIYISTRSACASGETEPSRVLLAMGFDTIAAAGGLRVSFSPDNTEDEMDYVCRSLVDVLGEYKQAESGSIRKMR